MTIESRQLKHSKMRTMMCATTLLLAAISAAQEDGAHYDIANFSPANGGAGTQVTINGSGAGSKTVAVWFNGTPATFQKTAYAYQLIATVPAGATTGKITISNGTIKADSLTAFNIGGSSTGGGGGGNTPTVVDPPPHVTPPSTALTGHPRMWIRASDLPRLQGWATNANPVWKDLQTVANGMKTDMLQGKVPQMDNGDGEGNGYAYPTEEYAEMFAFMSLVDPVAANRTDWAKRAHDLMMYMMNQAILGPAANQPFRTPHFITYNRGRWYGESFPLVVDWCYGTFTPAEKAIIRKVFIRWVHESLDFNITGSGYCPTPAGLVNSPGLVGSHGQVRWAGNNYWCNHARNIGLMSLALDPADDVPATSADPKAGYLGDYIGNAIGSWMYIRNYAETHDLAGGLSPEGASYSESSFSALTMLMLALHTAGYDSPGVYGPGAALAQNAFWKSDAITGYLHSLSPQTASFYSWQPQMYLPAGYGDVLRFETIDMVRVFGPLAAMDIADGNLSSPRLNAMRWIQTWASPGGPANQHTRLITSPQNYGTMLPIMYFLMFDPNGPTPMDPRVGMPVDYVAAGLNRLLSRTDWSSTASWFMFISAFNSIDHQWADSNSFSFYRGGEFLTKEWSGYGKNISASDYQNNLSIQNPPSGLGIPSFTVDEGAHGGQYSYSSDGDPVVKTSTQPGYSFAEGDVTKRYNTTTFHATDVQHASRSIFFLKPDFVVVYDRATSKSAGRYKRIYFNVANAPSLSTHGATATTPKGQKLYVSSLLPASGVVTYDHPTTTWAWNENTADEPMHYRVKVEDPSSPLDVRFLTVLQGASANAAQIPASLVNASAGAAYDGAVFGDTAVMFAVNLGQAFTGLTYTVPSSVTTHYVTGLTAGASYSVTMTSTPGGVTVAIASSGGLIADSAGVLHF